MKKMFFAPVRTVIVISVAMLLLSFTQKESFFERIFATLKGNINHQIHQTSRARLAQQQLKPGAILEFNPGATCSSLAADAIGGNVWGDYNFDGDKSTESDIFGIKGIKVDLYNQQNVKVGTATTDDDGNYLFSDLSATKYRVEFIIPTAFQEYSKATQSGVNNGTSIQFVAPGNCADFGIGNPNQYCDDNPYLITPCYVSGEPSLGGSAGIGDVLVAYPYAAGGEKSDVKPLALNKDMGTTWGIAYAKTSQNIYAAAMMKRHAGFGPLGIGGIYKVDYSDPNNPVLENWLDLASKGVDIGTNPRNFLLPAASGDSSVDSVAFDAVGKIGIGDIDISEDEETLYAINLNDNGSLVVINIANKSIIKEIAIPNPVCGDSGDVRPWGLSIYKGDVYVGAVCSGQIGGSGDLQFFIVKYDGTSFSTVFTEKLDYTKGFVHLTYDTPNAPSLCSDWETWASDFNEIHEIGTTANGSRWCRPQPILSDIEFDRDGSMVLAFMDRAGHQTGYVQAATFGGILRGSGYIGGDILRVHNNNGVFELENEGTTSAGGGAGLNNLPGSIGADTILQGPGGGEYYNGEKFDPIGYPLLHQETSLGGISIFHGHNLVALNVMDPTTFYTGGTAWLNNSTGQNDRVFELYNSNPNFGSTNNSTTLGSFGKAAGLGDLELTCALAPLELGNYVWNDKNGDGIQNPEENGIDGVPVELIKNGIVVATTTTANGGQYYFTKFGSPNQNWASATGKILPNMEYCIQIELDAAALNSNILTLSDADNSTNGNSRDNDAKVDGEYAKIILTTGNIGAVAHEYDFGFRPKLSVGNLVWNDANNNGKVEASEKGIEAIEMILFEVGADLTKGTADDLEIARDTTDPNGNYLFTNLNNGIYFIKLNEGIPSNMVSSIGSGTKGQDAKTYEPGIASSTDIDNDDNGSQMGSMVMSDTFTLKACTEPINDGDANFNTNLSIDFGLIPCMTIGNLVWNDINNNGLVEPTEKGISGVEVVLYQLGPNGQKGDNDDVIIKIDTTEVNGNYLFEGLKPGDYYVKLNSGIPTGMKSSTGEGIVVVLGTGDFEPAADPNNNKNNNDDGSQMGAMIMSGVVNLELNEEPIDDGDVNPQSNLTIDFGLHSSMCIGDYVWLDKNSDGIQDNSEKGIEGVKVELIKNGTLIATTTTDKDGIYLFTTDGVANQTWVTANTKVLPNMDYTIRINKNQVTLDKHTLTYTNKTNDLEDNDAIANGDYLEIDLTSGTTGTVAHQYDFGFRPTLCVGNLVWNDANNNGQVEASEKGMAAIEMILFEVGPDLTKGTPDDQEIARDTTDQNGNYLFTDLNEGVYFIKINDGIPSNFVSSTGSGSKGKDAKNYEPGIATSTDINNDDNGSQMGNMVMSDTFTLKVCTEPINDGDDNSNTNLSVDFGLIPCMTIGNLVWEDANNNGLVDPAEKGIAGVEVQLYKSGNDGKKGGDDILAGTIITKIDGKYLFEDLKPGDYYVKLNSGIPSNMISSTGEGIRDNNGSGTNEPAPNPDANTSDNDDNGSQMGNMVMSDLFNLELNQEPITDGDSNPNTNLAVDFGLFKLMSLGNLVWKDFDNNGICEKGEKGVPGVEAILFQIGPDGQKATNDDVEIKRDTTDAKGHYLFTQLLPGDYFVKLAYGIPLGYGSSTGEGIIDVDGVGPFEQAPDPDNDANNDDNGNQMDNMIMSDLVSLVLNNEPINDEDTDNMSNLSIDFGLFELLRLGNLVWEDYNNNGFVNIGEPGISGVETILFQVGPDGIKGNDDDVEISRTITDEAGHYLFIRIIPGEYYVKLNSGINGFNSSTGEGINRITGNGIFENAPDPDNDMDNEDNGNQMGAMVMSDLINMEFMQEPVNDGDNFANSNFSLDFGLFQPLAIGNIVWEDLNNNGVKDEAETGFQGIEVILFEAGIDGTKSTDDDLEIDRMLTNGNGNYLFSNLKPGNYYIKLNNVPSNYTSSNGLGLEQVGGSGPYEPGLVSNTDINSDDNGSQMDLMVMSDIITLALYSEPITDGDNDRKTNLTLDFGIVKKNQVIIHNPCTCLNNESGPGAGDGQFTERIAILSNVSGETWSVMAQTSASNSDNSPIAIGAVAEEDGTNDGQFRYIFDIKHTDGIGYSIKFSNGKDNLTVSNLCNYNPSCSYIIPEPSCLDCTPSPPEPDTCKLTFIIGTDGVPRIDSLNCCDKQSTFIDDGSYDGLYADMVARNDIFTICPQNQWQTLKFNFSEFGTADGDTLFVFDGRKITDSLLLKAGGEGISQTGGWVVSSCSPSINESGCLTFRFVTNGDNNKSIGWNGNFECSDRKIKLTPPNIPPVKLTCTQTSSIFTIKTATIKANCGIVKDSQIVRVFNAHGDLCKDTCLAINESFQEAFAIGQYRVEYKLKTDTVKTTQTIFSVQGAAHVCNDLVKIPLGVACMVAISPDDLLEGPCDTIADTLYYYITIKGNGKSGEEIIASGGGRGGNYPIITKEQFEKYGGKLTAEIEKRYYEGLTLNICNNGVKNLSCTTQIEIDDNSAPIFWATTPDTFKVCDIDLTEKGLGLTKPKAVDNCEEVTVVFTSATIIDDGGACDTTRVDVVWSATDKEKNVNTITQKVVFIRSSIGDLVKPKDKILSCGVDTEAAFNDLSKVGVPSIKIGKVKNGVLIPSDTIPLSTEKYICGYILQKRDIQIESDCGKKLYRYWDILDWCESNTGPIHLDTQYIELKDITAPKFVESTLPFSILELGHNSCTYDITKLTTPIATDNCSAVSVRMDKVFRIENGSLWEVTTAINQLNCDSFQIRWVAEDACHEQLKNDTIKQTVLIKDNTKPSAICADKLQISIGTEKAKVHYSSIEAGSYDACGIVKYEVSRDEKIWSDYVEFHCADVHHIVTVYLRVTDSKGNQNTCWMDVSVEDKIAPICSNLPDAKGICDAQHSTVFGPSTDTNEDGKMSHSEWIDMTEEQVNYYNNKYGEPNCSDNLSCEELNIHQQYQLISWPCGMIDIKRRYQAVDWQGEGNISNWSEQSIKIEYKANWSITFPADWEGSCGKSIPTSSVQIENGACDLMAYEVDEQTFTSIEDACLKVVRTFTVINWCKYDVNAPVIKIARPEGEHGFVSTSTTITSEGMEDAGKIQYIQILKVRDTEAPEVTVLEPDVCIYGVDGDAAPYGVEDVTPGISPYECDELKTWTGYATDCTSPGQLRWVARIYENGQLVKETNTKEISYVVKNKFTYNAEFWVYDGCGNSAGVTTEPDTFWDCKKPTPYCLNGSAVAIMPTGMIQVWAKDVNQGSYDNCTSEDRLKIKIWHQSLGLPPTSLEEVEALPEQITFTCGYLGIQDVSLYVIDEEGNWDFCTTYIIIQDNNGGCKGLEPQAGMAKITGMVMDWKGKTVEEVMVRTTTINSPLGNSEYMTKENGIYQFELPMNEDYRLVPVKDILPLNGVSTFDLVLISKHILGINKFETPYQYIAADVNNSGSVTAYDMVQLRRLILNLDTKFNNNTSWTFVEANYEFTSDNPAAEHYPTLSFVEDLAHNMQKDFTAIKVGDVNGNARPNNLVQAEARNTAGIFELITEDKDLKAGSTYSVTFATKQLSNIQGYQFTLGFENLQFNKLTNGMTDIDNFGLHKIENGYITTSWNQLPVISDQRIKSTRTPQATQLFTIEFTAKKDGKLSEQLKITNRPTVIEAYNQGGEMMDIKLVFANSVAATKDFAVYQNEPNPFQSQTKIGFYLPENSDVVLTLRDEMGRLLKEIKENKNAGSQFINLNNIDLPKGLIYYQISTKFGTKTKKMLRVE